MFKHAAQFVRALPDMFMSETINHSITRPLAIKSKLLIHFSSLSIKKTFHKKQNYAL